MGVGTKEGFCFDADFLGDRAGLLQRLHHAHFEVLGDPFNNGGLTDCCTQYKFSRGFWALYVTKYAI